MTIMPDQAMPVYAAALIEAAKDAQWENALQSGYIEQFSPNKGGYQRSRWVRCVVWHITEGTYASALSWLTNPASGASSNDLISRVGLVAHLVPGHESPWTNGKVQNPDLSKTIVAQTIAQNRNPNTVSYTIECAGLSTRGRGDSLTAQQIAALVIRTAQACMVYNLTADHEHILRHSHWDSVDRAGCPGFSKAEFASWVAATHALTVAWRGW